MSRAFNAEWQINGVRSVFIAPGSMKTPMGRKVRNQDFNTFIEPYKVAKIMKDLLNKKKSKLANEIKIKRKIYR